MKTLSILISLLALFAAPVYALDIPPDFSARYKLEKYGTTIGEVKLSLRSEGNILIYTSNTEPRGLAALFRNDKINETSRLRVKTHDTMPQLLHYEYNHHGKQKKNQHFDVENVGTRPIKITGASGSKVFTTQAGGPVWDRLSVQLALACDASNAPQLKKTYLYKVFDHGELSDYTFEYTGETTQKIAGQVYHVLTFTRYHGKRETLFWLARELHYLPVKMQQYKNGDLHLSMHLDRIDI